MDLFSFVEDYLFASPIIASWQDMRAVFKKAASGKPRQWNLPAVACEAVGGADNLAVPAMTSIACLHISIILIDDMLDNDPRGEYIKLGFPTTANLAVAFNAASYEAWLRSEKEAPYKLAGLEKLTHAAQLTAFGQFLDTQNISDEASYWHMIQTKSSPFFGTALYLGALAGGSSLEEADKLYHLGSLYGECLQIHDDLSDAFATPPNPDWLQGRVSLPFLYAQVVNHPDRDRFMDLRGEIQDPGKLAEAQDILIRSGAVSYCIECIIYKFKEAQTVLENISVQNKTILRALLDSLISPVQDLLDKLEISYTIPSHQG